MASNETWRTIKGYEKYEVSNYGNVRSKDRIIFRKDGKTMRLNSVHLKSIEDRKGYLHVSLYNDKGIKTPPIHRLVAIAFIDNGNNLPQVNHIDGNKKNNCVDNLEWCDNKYNQIHALKNGARLYMVISQR